MKIFGLLLPKCFVYLRVLTKCVKTVKANDLLLRVHIKGVLVLFAFNNIRHTCTAAAADTI